MQPRPACIEPATCACDAHPAGLQREGRSGAALRPGAKPNAAARSAVPELPKDDRSSEVTAALAFTLGFGGRLLLEPTP